LSLTVAELAVVNVLPKEEEKKMKTASNGWLFYYEICIVHLDFETRFIYAKQIKTWNSLLNFIHMKK
jgi:hypothetical protein